MWIYLYEKKNHIFYKWYWDNCTTIWTVHVSCRLMLKEVELIFFLQVKVKSKSEREDMWRSNVLIHSRCVYIKSDCIWMTLTVTVWSQCSGWGGQAPPEPSLSSQTPKQHTGREHLEHKITILVQEQTIHIELYTLWMSMKLQK